MSVEWAAGVVDVCCSISRSVEPTRPPPYERVKWSLDVQSVHHEVVERVAGIFRGLGSITLVMAPAAGQEPMLRWRVCGKKHLPLVAVALLPHMRNQTKIKKLRQMLEELDGAG